MKKLNSASPQQPRQASGKARPRARPSAEGNAATRSSLLQIIENSLEFAARVQQGEVWQIAEAEVQLSVRADDGPDPRVAALEPDGSWQSGADLDWERVVLHPPFQSFETEVSTPMDSALLAAMGTLQSLERQVRRWSLERVELRWSILVTDRGVPFMTYQSESSLRFEAFHVLILRCERVK